MTLNDKKYESLVTAIVGANWGDEGKGKVTDLLASEADIVVRFQGGANAGHTIINALGKFALHLLPSGVFHRNVTNVIGPGVALDLQALIDELKGLEKVGLTSPPLLISDRAQIVLPVHKLLDAYEEDRLGNDSFGSTKKGIAPFYADKYLKIGVTVADTFDREYLLRRVERALATKRVLFEHVYRKSAPEAKAITDEVMQSAAELRSRVGDTTQFLRTAMEKGRRILLEGQLGALRDPDHGIYPFSTSSSTLAGFASVGAGIPANAIGRVIAVAKAYSTCVGAGPFVTELRNSEGETLRRRGAHGGEYGATTGRPRRVGWFDAVATSYGARIQGATEVFLTMIDVLGYLDSIPLCIKYEIDGKTTSDFPVTRLLEKARPVYESVPGWKTDISGVQSYADLPANARRYVERIEDLIGTPITGIGIGAKREDVIWRTSSI